MAFGIWSIVACIFVYIGLKGRKSDTAVGFFSNVDAPKVKDIKAYNREVSNLFFTFAGLLEVSGLPLINIEQNSPLAIMSVLAVVFLSLGTIIRYTFIENKYRDE